MTSDMCELGPLRPSLVHRNGGRAGRAPSKERDVTKNKNEARAAASPIWGKIDVLARFHPKILAAGPIACWLWVCGILWCNTQKRHDGFIPAAVVPTLYPLEADDLKRAVALLIKVGLWERRAGGAAQVHDYNDFQPTAAEMETRSSARAEAGRLGGVRSGETRRSKREASASKQREANAKREASEATKPDLDLGPIPILSPPNAPPGDNDNASSSELEARSRRRPVSKARFTPRGAQTSGVAVALEPL